jgi:uncharacterized membrane protein
MLREYDTILPGAADRIIAMAEAQSRHRQELESKAIASDIANSRTGLHYGLIIGLTAIIGGCACIALGYQVGGSIIGGTGLTSLVGVFVYGTASRRKERERRLSMLAKGEADWKEEDFRDNVAGLWAGFFSWNSKKGFFWYTEPLHVSGKTGSCGRGGQIWTDDPLLPKQVRYQAAPRPDSDSTSNMPQFLKQVLGRRHDVKPAVVDIASIRLYTKSKGWKNYVYVVFTRC